MSPRRRSSIFAIAAICLVWLIAIGGYAAFKNSCMTAQKLRAYIERTNLDRLQADARAKALRDLADKINALSPEERQQARRARLWDEWFKKMSENEKSAFLESTLPSGFKQMMASFETMTPEKRQKAIDNATKRLKDLRDNPPEDKALAGLPGDTNAPPVLSEDLQKQVAMIGMKSVYSSGSAQTKAELAPLLEELQKNLESGRLLRGGGH